MDQFHWILDRFTDSHENWEPNLELGDKIWIIYSYLSLRSWLHFFVYVSSLNEDWKLRRRTLHSHVYLCDHVKTLLDSYAKSLREHETVFDKNESTPSIFVKFLFVPANAFLHANSSSIWSQQARCSEVAIYGRLFCRNAASRQIDGPKFDSFLSMFQQYFFLMLYP